MKIKIQSIHFDADKKLLDFIYSKTKKLGHFYDNIIGADVILRLEKSNDNENKVVEIRIKIPGNDLFAKRQCRSFEEATDIAVEALIKQLKKHKEKAKRV